MNRGDLQSERDRAKKESQIQRAKEDLKSAEKTRERYQDYHKDAQFQRSKNYWNYEVKSQDKEIEQKRRTLQDLENSR